MYINLCYNLYHLPLHYGNTIRSTSFCAAWDGRTADIHVSLCQFRKIFFFFVVYSARSADEVPKFCSAFNVGLVDRVS